MMLAHGKNIHDKRKEKASWYVTKLTHLEKNISPFNFFWCYTFAISTNDVKGAEKDFDCVL